MGNTSSSSRRRHRRSSSNATTTTNQPPTTTPPAPPPQQEVVPNRYVFAAVTPYPAHAQPHHHPYYHPYPGYYPPTPSAMPVPLPAPYDHHHRGGGGHVEEAGHWRYPCGPMVAPPAPYVEHQKAVTIRNDVNLKKESLKLVSDLHHPGFFLVSFTFDATVPGSITVIFFAKEGEGCILTSTKEDLPPVTVQFPQGLGQKFIQPSGTGINLSDFEDTELLHNNNMDVYPLAVKAEASPVNETESDETPATGNTNSQITQAVFEKDRGEYQVRVMKQILWVNKMRYELQEIYGIGNSAEGEVDANDPGKECVICLSEPRDTTVLPCRHMCMCSGCAKVLRFQTTRCPICRQPVERLLEIKVNGNDE